MCIYILIFSDNQRAKISMRIHKCNDESIIKICKCIFHLNFHLSKDRIQDWKIFSEIEIYFNSKHIKELSKYFANFLTLTLVSNFEINKV